MTYDDVIQSQSILEDLVTLFSSVVAWTASEEGTRRRHDMNRAHAAMEESFDRWLDATMPGDFMQISTFEDQAGPSSISSPSAVTAVSPSTYPERLASRRPPSLPDISIRSFPDVSFSSPGNPCTYPVTTPPPLSPLCRYRHASSRACNYCHGIPRKSNRASARSAPYSYSPESTPPRKRARWSPNSDNSATLVYSGSPEDDQASLLSSSDNMSDLHAPSMYTVGSGSDSDDSTSYPPLACERHELRPLLRRPRDRQPTPQSSPAPKTSSWLRILKEFLPFL